MTINYTRTGRQVLDLGSHSAIRQDMAAFEREQENSGQGNLSYAWFTGGALSTALSSVDRIQFDTDAQTASGRGNLSVPRASASATGNTTSGWVFGGTVDNVNATTSFDRINFNNDLVTAQVRSGLTFSKFRMASFGNSTDGWIVGGGKFEQSSTLIYKDVERLNFANETIGVTGREFLPIFRFEMAASGNSTDAWICTGRALIDTGFVGISTVERMIFSNDINLVQTRNPVQRIVRGAAGVGNSTNMWIINGQINGDVNAANTTSTERITFASDTSTTSIRGNTTIDRRFGDASGNTTDAWISGNSPSASSTVERISFTNDLVLAQVRGPLNTTVSAPAALT